MTELAESQRSLPEPAEVAAQIDRSLSSIWERRDGVRPVAVKTTFEVDAVRCVIEPGARADVVAGFESSLESTSYRNEAIASVSRLTRRKVDALIVKQPSKKTTTNTFLLEPRRGRN